MKTGRYRPCGAPLLEHRRVPGGERERSGFPQRLFTHSGGKRLSYPTCLTQSHQAPLSVYSMPAGQAYVADAAPVPADDFFAKNPADTVVTGTEIYDVVQYNHRLALLNTADLRARLR